MLTQSHPNPYRDKLTGREYLKLMDRLDKYAKTYDNDERDQDRTKGIVDIVDISGDPQVGSLMRFHGENANSDYLVQRYNGGEKNYSSMREIAARESDGKVYITQYADDNGDMSAEIHRETVIDRRTARILKSEELI